MGTFSSFVLAARPEEIADDRRAMLHHKRVTLLAVRIDDQLEAQVLAKRDRARFVADVDADVVDLLNADHALNIFVQLRFPGCLLAATEIDAQIRLKG